MAASGNPHLSALWIVAPEEAIEEVSKALRRNDGNVTATAAELNVIRETIYRWMREHKMLARVRDKAEHDAIERDKREGILR
jgi:transposase-like protein